MTDNEIKDRVQKRIQELAGELARSKVIYEKDKKKLIEAKARISSIGGGILELKALVDNISEKPSIILKEINPPDNITTEEE